MLTVLKSAFVEACVVNSRVLQGLTVWNGDCVMSAGIFEEVVLVPLRNVAAASHHIPSAAYDTK